MGITYHTNAKTTVYIRQQIKMSTETLTKICERYNLSESTVVKWKQRDDMHDRSCRPHKLNTVLSELDEWVICETRKTTLFSIDELTEILKPFIAAVNRDNIYRCLKRHGLSCLAKMKSSEEKKEESKEFKTYEPGYIHVDIKQMPKLKGEQERKYLFVAIDRATRYVCFSFKDNKEARSAVEFLNEIIEHFPYKIHKILTDNGKEFTDRFIRGRQTATGRHLFDGECARHGIEHRLTRPYIPETNGMVERFNGRIEEILDNNKFDNYTKLIEALNQYLICYNNFNKQKVLGYKTPIEMIKYWYDKKREIFKDGADITSYNLSQPDMFTVAGIYVSLRIFKGSL